MQNLKIPPIETGRLLLISMSVEFLRAMIAKDYETAEEIGGFSVPRSYSLPTFRAERRLKMIEKAPEQHPWMYRSIVRKQDKAMIGNISFHHKAPDPDLLEHADLAVELGYTIEPVYRRKGYAKESAFAMMEWAHREQEVLTFFLSIRPANTPSLRMGESMNFSKVGEKQDPIDGLEYLMRAEIDQILEAKNTYQAASCLCQ